MRIAVIAAAAVLATFAAGCGSSSGTGSTRTTHPATTHANTKACMAINDVKKQVSKLQGVASGSVSPVDAAAAVQALQQDISKLGTAASRMTGAARDDLQRANEAFSKAVNEIVASVTSSSGSLSDAVSKLQTAAQKLGDSYRQVLSDLNC